MKQPRTKIAQTIADATLQNGISKKFSKEVAAYLLTSRRVSDLDSLLRDIQADWAAAGHLEVVAASAHGLTAPVKADISRRVKQLHPEAKQIMITEVIDPTIMGGVRLQLPHEQLDLSVQAKLNRFKQLTAAGKD